MVHNSVHNVKHNPFRLKCTAIQWQAALGLYLVIIKEKGKPELCVLLNALHVFLVTLLKPGDLPTDDIATVTDQLLFLSSIRPEENYCTASIVLASCSAIQYALRSISVHISRLKFHKTVFFTFYEPTSIGGNLGSPVEEEGEDNRDGNEGSDNDENDDSDNKGNYSDENCDNEGNYSDENDDNKGNYSEEQEQDGEGNSDNDEVDQQKLLEKIISIHYTCKSLLLVVLYTSFHMFCLKTDSSEPAPNLDCTENPPMDQDDIQQSLIQ
jgi:hypothetical protein